MTTLTVRAGKLVAWKIRQFCEEAVDAGYRIEWSETNGWLQSVFEIKGDDDHVDDLADQFSQFGVIVDG